MKLRLVVLLSILCISKVASAENWPKEIKTQGGAVILIYQPQPESMTGNILQGRSAFSVKEHESDEPIFGVFWYSATLNTNRDTRTAELESIRIREVKLPGLEDQNKMNKLSALLESEIPKWQITASLDDIAATIETEHASNSPEFKNDAPAIHFVSTPTMLVLIDGEPKWQQDENLKMKKVLNSAFLIVEDPGDHKIYLYGGNIWYVSSQILDGYAPVKALPTAVGNVDKALKKEKEKNQKPEDNGAQPSMPPAIMVSTVPAELIQSDGEPQFANIQPTNLLFVSNSQDDIFKSITDQNYYVLLSGRWYSARDLKGPWTYIASDKLPQDFSQIPEGTTKDNVLASVAGTPASREAVMDAQIPQTAKVDRKSAQCTVKYDGEPKFEAIEGTSLQVAVNTSSTVLKSGNKFYCVETGVWFVADAAKGPWKVSDERPKDVDKIPASSKAYNVRYVEIYDATPEVVYVGYTPGYMGCYVYGGTVVYGTGYYYNPWYGPYYYPMPVTYGFSMHYNPWCGWSMGFHYSTGWFTFSVYGRGYWGPPVYRPPYYPPYRGGMYGGRGPTYIHNGDINIDRSNNVYNRRNGVNTNDVKRGQGAGRPSQQPSRQPGVSDRSRNDVYSDRNGNVYQRNNNGNWNQRGGNGWQQTPQTNNMDRDFQNRERSNQRNNNFQQMNRGGGMGGGGGMRGGGGGRRR